MNVLDFLNPLYDGVKMPPYLRKMKPSKINVMFPALEHDLKIIKNI